MSKKHVREIAREYEISLKHISLVIDADPEKLSPSFSITGRADPNSIGRVDLFPKAFSSKEELVRTLYHELVHVTQFREFGALHVMENRSHFEKLAYEAEDVFIAKMKEARKI